jgi:hypothetical protein
MYNGWIFQLIDRYGKEKMKGWTIWTDWAGSDELMSVPRAVIRLNQGRDARPEFPRATFTRQQVWDEMRYDEQWTYSQLEGDVSGTDQFPPLLTTGLPLPFPKRL